MKVSSTPAVLRPRRALGSLLLAVALNSQVLRYYYEPAFLLIAAGAGLGGLVPGNASRSPIRSQFADATAA